MRDVFFGPESSKLHGVLISASAPGAPAALLCHPHPQYGGSMNNNVILGVESVLADAGFTTLRFNFRGVGRSGGISTAGSDTAGEQEDVAHAISFLEADESVGAIHFVGYSFGAMVGLKAALGDNRISTLTGIAPPTVMSTFSFLESCSKPLLVIAGSQDDFCDASEIKRNTTTAGGDFEIIPGADHFFINQEHKIGDIILQFIKNK